MKMCARRTLPTQQKKRVEFKHRFWRQNTLLFSFYFGILNESERCDGHRRRNAVSKFEFTTNQNEIKPNQIFDNKYNVRNIAFHCKLD